LIGVYILLFIVCCLLFVVGCLLFVVCCWLFVVGVGVWYHAKKKATPFGMAV
jgi:hypothetical protein